MKRPKRKLVYVTSHPIQYQVPVFQHLSKFEDLELLVLYCMLPNETQQGAGFGAKFCWDIPMLEGYKWQVLNNVSDAPSVTDFAGCDTPEIGSLLAKLRPNVVVVNGWVVKSCLQTLWACIRLRIPCMVRGESNDLVNRPSWKVGLQSILVKRFAACLYIGQANKSFYESRGVAKKRLHSSPYCVENQRFGRIRSTEEISALRSKYKIPSGAVVFLYSGKFEDKKHPLELLQSFNYVARNRPNAHLIMVGDGALKQECERYAVSHAMPVTFTGFLNQTVIPEAYSVSNWLVLPSDARETWGLVVNEAMASSVPVIASDRVGCAKDLIRPGITGWTFPSEDWRALSECMLRVSAEQHQQAMMGRNAKEHIARYTPLLAALGIRDAALHVC